MIRMIYLQLPNCHYQQTVQQQLLPYSSYLMIFAFSLMVPNQTDFFFLFSPVGCLNHCPYHMWMLFLRGKTHCLFPLNAKFLPLPQGPYLKYLDREAVEWVSGLLSFMPWYGLYWKKKKTAYVQAWVDTILPRLCAGGSGEPQALAILAVSNGHRLALTVQFSTCQHIFFDVCW